MFINRFLRQIETIPQIGIAPKILEESYLNFICASLFINLLTSSQYKFDYKSKLFTLIFNTKFYLLFCLNFQGEMSTKEIT